MAIFLYIRYCRIFVRGEFMHYGKYGLKEIVEKQDMENEFFWIRKNYYTDLLKLFVCRDIDDYENYKLDLYFTFHFLNIVIY